MAWGTRERTGEDQEFKGGIRELLGKHGKVWGMLGVSQKIIRKDTEHL